MKVAEIHGHLFEAIVEKYMKEGIARKWVIFFNDGRMNMHDDEQSERFSVIIENLPLKVYGKASDNEHFKISSLCNEFS